MINDAIRGLRKIFQLEGFDIAIVGGAVRDHIMEIAPKDIDFCTDATPSQQIDIYKKYNYRYIPTGIDHGTITVVINDVSYEITTLRKDVETDGRHAKVEFTSDWKTDLARRDLTINAMMMTLDGNIIDPYNGRSDLEKGIIRFVGNADDRIKEDYLRILRWFRFLGRYGDFYENVHTQQLESIKQNVHGLKNISVERIWSEIKKIISHYYACKILFAMKNVGVFDVIMPPGDYAFDYLSLSYAKTITNDPAVLMMAWIGYDTDKIEKIYEDWHWSNAEYNHAFWICDNIGKINYHRMIAVNNDPKEWVIELVKLNKESDAYVKRLEEWSYTPFPINGGDLLKIGILPGPQIGQVLKSLKDIWAMHGYNMTKNQLLMYVE